MIDNAELQKLLDRQSILDCLTRYSRGVDRFDKELVRSAYHADAIDDHGSFVGTRDDFIEWAFALHAAGQISTQHHLTNHSCELNGNEAHTETYYLFTARNVDETLWVAGGRYLDRLERRDSSWKIASRYCVVEWSGTLEAGAIPFSDIPDVHVNGVPCRSKDDPSYRRPLINKRALRIL